MDPPGVTDHVHYVESVEASTYKPRVHPSRPRQGLLDLGQGVTPKKLAVVALTLVISMRSILLFSGWEQPPETPSAGPGFPTTPDVVLLQTFVLGLINEEREG